MAAKLLRKHLELFDLISRAEETLRNEGSEGLTRAVVQSRLEQLEKNWEKFETNHDSLFGQGAEPKEKDHEYFTGDV